MADVSEAERAAEKARRRAAHEMIAAYHQEELRRLLEHVRTGFAQFDAGEVNEFELDELIHRYKKAAAKLWSFCGSTGSQQLQAARAIEHWRDLGEPRRDWWAEAESRER